MKKFGIYDPYFHILGGAERYILFIAQALSFKGEVILFGANSEEIRKAKIKFGFPTLSVTPKPWFASRTLRFQALSALDTFFYVTDGSIFLSPAKRNILIIQTPLHTPVKTLTNQLKLFSWQTLIVYSQFMANIVKKKLHRKPQVLFVPVAAHAPVTTKKKNSILSVGRFFTHLHSKKQLEMVKAFKHLCDSGLTAQLHLVGSVDPGGEGYLQEVQKEAQGYPIHIHTDISYRELEMLYSEAKIYWHAAGYNEDLQKFPEKAEHFGVVTLEAQSYEVVPIVFAGGGQKELVTHNVNGFLWDSVQTLQDITRMLLANEKVRQQISNRALLNSQNYTFEKFSKTLYEILNF